MCVLGRPFSIRQMVEVGKNVVLMRDMTDTMYNSRMRPFVNHFRGTDLIVEHIEKYWCPSITSADLLGGEPFRFSKDPENPAAKKPSSNYVSPGEDGPLSPRDSAASFTTFDDLEITQVLAEPEVMQPVHLSWDERGRLWVVQYLQYPAPAGLTLVSKDQFWRAVYDKAPPPPPGHFRGEDKITIHEDTDGDGIFDRHKTFVEGLNIVTAVEHGRGGKWVLNPPYLLFFPDANEDDIVDGNPAVHLAGFGLEDTHSVANSLRWGPDGWLYGAHGSTVTASIVRPGLDKEPVARMMGQGIWRYHPESRQFEIFAEGGGNAFGLELDDQGRIFSGHNGGNTRGFHYVQGGYLQKGFEKHGPLSNPHAFGYFKQMAHNDVERFTHTFVIYGGAALPGRYTGQLLGIEPMQGRVVLSEVLRDGSSFRTRDAGYAVTTSDKYFKPVDIKTGPDGAVYVADWHDRQVTHTRNYEGSIDKSNGRIYRIAARGSRMTAEVPQPNPEALAPSLRSENRWIRQNTQRQLAGLRDPSLAAKLLNLCLTNSGQLALEALWAWHGAGGSAESAAPQLLKHPDPHVRAWTVRLIGDRREISESVARELASLAVREPHVEVRSQLASSARRLPASQMFPILKNLLTHDEDSTDIHLPLLLWWALECKADADRESVLAFLADDSVWQSELMRQALLERLVMRYAIGATLKDFRTCAKVIERAAAHGLGKTALAAFEKAVKGRSLAGMPPELQKALAAAGGESLALALRQGKAEAVAQALHLIASENADVQQRIQLIQVFGEVRHESAAEPLMVAARQSKSATLRKEVVSALQLYRHPAIPGTLISLLSSLAPEGQLSALAVLSSREAWAGQLVEAVRSGDLPKGQVPAEVIEKLRAYDRLGPGIDSVWGPKASLSKTVVDDKLASFARVVRSGSGDPFAGYNHYTMLCGACHRLFGEGGQIGPDLTPFQRDNLEAMLMSIVNPGGEIREGYESVVVETKDGRSLSGFVAEQFEDGLVLRGLDGGRQLVRHAEIAETRAAGASLMPEGLLEALEEQQVRDLFAYLRSTQPLVKR
jgi:putative membrane-bound dehydrogenase-like protein